MKKLTIIFFLFTANYLTAQIPKSWQVVRNDTFCVAFPSKPDYSKERTQFGGCQVVIKKYIVAEEKPEKKWARCFYLFYHDYPASYFKGLPREEYLKALSKALAPDSSLSERKRINMGNYFNSGVEVSGYDFQKYKFNFIARFYLIGNRLYRLYASESDSLSYDARLFLTAFEVYSK